jgi:hypothetical protein
MEVAIQVGIRRANWSRKRSTFYISPDVSDALEPSTFAHSRGLGIRQSIHQVEALDSHLGNSPEKHQCRTQRAMLSRHSEVGDASAMILRAEMKSPRVQALHPFGIRSSSA